ncbi:CopG family transcriptional regulator [Streptomyces sp. NPDC051740]|uniref:CopG family transcriptional regulator n=1 Tax=Streptomyces sp. NPDC051740 TaxID=3365673 RepID=UPI0037A65AE0
MSLKRTTVYLEEDDLHDLKDTAARRGISEAELIREGVHLAIARNRVWDEPAGLPVLDSGDATFAERGDEILGETGFGHGNEAS